MFFGIVLIILGVLILFREIGIIDWSFWAYLWPVLIIALGVKMILGDKAKPSPPKPPQV